MKLDDETITILSTAIEIRGVNVVIVQQLGRKSYLAVNKVLEACGGAWSRKAKAHVFTADPTPAIERALLTGEIATTRDLDFFPTPASLAERLVANVKAGDRVLEPSAGAGNLVAPCLARGAHVTICERDPAMRGALARTFGAAIDVLDHADFLDVDPEGAPPFDRVVMNPPFAKVGRGAGIDHVRHAAQMLRPSGTLTAVLGAGVHFREDTRHREFRAWLTDLGGLIAPLPDGSFKASGTDVRTVCVTLVRR